MRRRRAAKMVRAPRFSEIRETTSKRALFRRRRAFVVEAADPSPPKRSSSTASDDERPNIPPTQAKKLGARLKQGEIAGYTDAENPFGDANLTERFVWHKKIEKSLMSGVDAKDLGLKAEKARHEARLLEIEKVKQQREQRDREKMEKEQERELMQREEALIEAVELEKKEEEFHVAQAKMRSDIRVREGRARAVDLVARNVDAEVGSGEFDPGVDPLRVFANLTTQELHELRDDAAARADLAKADPARRAFWDDFLTVTLDELARARERDAVDRARVRGRDPAEAAAQARDVHDRGLHAQVERDVAEMLEGKSRAELEALEAEVSATLADPDAPEVEYWQAVLRRISVGKARAAIEEFDARTRAAHEAARPRDVPPPPRGSRDDAREGGAESDDDEDLLGADFGVAARRGTRATSGDDDDLLERPPRSPEPENGGPEAGFTPEGTPDREYSPPLEDEAKVPAYVAVVDAAEDADRLRAARAAASARLGRFADASGRRLDARAERLAVAGPSAADGRETLAGDVGDDADAERVSASRALAEKMMGANDGAEVAFAGEAALEAQAYWWHDKFRPRKPKYFNRVHTGYDWNKYNQTHYDHDNPPPKTVQGYKFNLFYPDLIDKTKAPTYAIAPDGSRHGETCILRISAGPPYEDIAFKIVNKEWEYSNKRGFKCSFERGIFHLYINFKRARYRR